MLVRRNFPPSNPTVEFVLLFAVGPTIQYKNIIDCRLEWHEHAICSVAWKARTRYREVEFMEVARVQVRAPRLAVIARLRQHPLEVSPPEVKSMKAAGVRNR